jgi:hypothetical protein
MSCNYPRTDGSQWLKRLDTSKAAVAYTRPLLGFPDALRIWESRLSSFVELPCSITADVDLLVTQKDLEAIHEHLDGLGYIRPFATSKNLRDSANGVKIEFLITGEYPGDGKPKPVAFPHPKDVFEIRDGIKVLQLPRLIELKLASYMTGKARSKDLGDVEELIRNLKLPKDFATQLNPYVAPLFIQKWEEING